MTKIIKTYETVINGQTVIVNRYEYVKPSETADQLLVILDSTESEGETNV